MSTTLSELAPEVKWQLFYQLPAESAAALCQTSPEFADFCRQRVIRIVTLINYYRGQRERSQLLTFVTLLQTAKDIRDIEHIEALVTLHSEWLNRYPDSRRHTLTIDKSKIPLVIAALWQLGSNPMIPMKETVASEKYRGTVKGNEVPLIIDLSRYYYDPGFILALRIPASALSIPARIWELLPVQATSMMLNLPWISESSPLLNREQILTNMLSAAVKYKDYYSTRELLERGVNPRGQDTLDLTIEEENRPLYHALKVEHDVFLFLLLHYTTLTVKEATPYLPQGTTIGATSVFGKYVNGQRKIPSKAAMGLAIDYPLLLYFATHHTLSYWDDLLFWQDKWKRDLPETPIPPLSNGKMLRLAYRAVSTMPVIDMIFKLNGEAQNLKLRLDNHFENGLLFTLDALHITHGIRYHTIFNEQNPPALYSQPRSPTADASEMPYCNYTLTINRKKAQFDDLNFLRGAIKACELVQLDPKRYLKQFTRVSFD